MRSRVLAGVLLLALRVFAATGPEGGEGPGFEEEVQPILAKYCLTCHGKSSPEQGLDLRSAHSLFRGSFNGPVVRAGSPDESRLYLKVSQGEMPPPAFKSTVSEGEVAVIRRWIEAGAHSKASSEIPAAARKQMARFDEEIKPLFEQRCVACHGGDEPQSGLDLRSLASMLAGGTHGPVVLEGFSDKSVLVRQLVDGAMPPEGAGERLGADEIDRIRAWIDAGNFADYVDLGNPLDRTFTAAEAPPITQADRQHWAFQAPVSPNPPSVRASGRVKTPVDAFVVAALERRNLSLSRPASRETLLRRTYFDLWGLPPTPEQASAFLSDERPGAYERLIDRLLESPLYGQRWGRFWLDAAGYVDTTGKDFRAESPALAPGMWRYRDYVIDSFNGDKPWDRFLTEQLAGDELYDWRNADRYTPEMLEALIATGYLRTVLDATNEDISDRPFDRYQTLFALIDKVSRSALGLTLTCARCHSHKFDPIPQRDYYRFLALLSAAYNPSDWIQPKNRLMYTVSQSQKEEIDEHNEAVDAELEKLSSRLERVGAPYRERLREAKLAGVPDVVRDDVRDAVAAVAEERTEVQKYLVTKFGPSVEVSDEEVRAEASQQDRERLARLQRDVETWKGYRNDLQQVQALWDGKSLPVIRLLQRGSVESPGPRVKPGFLSILCGPDEECLAAASPNRAGETSGLRLSLAEWLTDPRHPLTARVIVNRIWQHHFGTGIVSTPDNFGRSGASPSNRELLDWLAVDFVDHGWKAKRLHKLIMMSSVYRQSSRRTDNSSHVTASTEDPDNRLLWRMPLRRLEAEALRDSVLAVAGRLDAALGGPPVMLDARSDGLQVEAAGGATRRSVYLLARRTWPATFMGTFDFPNIDTTCTRRAPSATPLQSLAMMNSDFVLENAAAAARTVQDQAAGSADLARLVARAAYRLVLARAPTDEEVELAREHLDLQRGLYARANATKDEAMTKAVAILTHMLISSNEFLYVN